jgi:hypothetical protein
MKHTDDGKYVVVKNGQRVSGQLHETKEAAQAEADKAKASQPVSEGQKDSEAPKVVQNLYG